MTPIRKFEITDALLIGYFSFVGYLLSLSKEFGYLAYFKIPSNFIHHDLLKDVNNLLLIAAGLSITYFLYQNLFRYSEYLLKSLKRSKKNNSLKITWIIIVKYHGSLIIPFIFFSFTNPTKLQFAFYTSVTLMVFLIIGLIELQLKRNSDIATYSLIGLAAFHLILLFSNFIIFWSAGLMYAKSNRHFISFDEGKSAVIYFSKEKMITKKVVNKKLVTESDFFLINIDDSTYHFEEISVTR